MRKIFQSKNILLFLLCPALFVGCQKQPELISQPVMTQTPLPIETTAPESTSSPLQSLSPRSTPTVTPKGTPLASIPPKSMAIISMPSEFKSDDPRDLNSVNVIVLHSLYNPTASDPYSIASIKKVLDDEKVSSHFIVTRDGKVYQFVQENYMAWHAGESTMPAPDGRSKVNYFSIGIELVGDQTSGFTNAQYASLSSLFSREMEKLPITTIVGHADIAPGRKTDPWKFDWKRFETDLKKQTSKTFKILGSH